MATCRAILGACCALAASAAVAAEQWQSHPPARPLPVAAAVYEPAANAKYVSANAGDDAGPGTYDKPWRTLGYAVAKLQPGDTLYLRGGTYHEHVHAVLKGTAGRPITVASYPGELAILDGGIPEMLTSPQTSWEPCPTGVPGEYWSTNTFPDLEQKEGDLRVGLLGRFADSMTPLHGYWHHPDLQSDNPFWTLGGGEKVKPDAHVYCGPGIWYDQETDRIHCRLAHTKLPGLGDDNYRGETDPRKVPLVVAGYGHGPVLTLEDSMHVTLRDFVVRGARQHTLQLLGGNDLVVQGLTLYGGQSCLKADGVQGLRMAHTACRGLAAPWTFRGSLKYRSIESKLLSTGGWEPSGADGRDYDIRYCEFTDSVDGLFIGNVRGVSIRDSLLENISDDGIFCTAGTAYDGTTPGGGVHIYGNRFARNLTCFAFGTGHGRQKTVADTQAGRWGTRQLGSGVEIKNNVFDFRRPVMYRWPSGPDDKQELDSYGRFAGDHGSPAWEPMVIRNNTIIAGDPPRYEYGTDGFSRAAAGTSRIITKNIVCQLKGLPGRWLPAGDVQQYFADENLFWSIDEVARAKPPPQPRYPRNQTAPSPAWGANDRFADPKFVRFDADWRSPVDLRLAEPADGCGAIEFGQVAWRVGCGGRLDVCGNAVSDGELSGILWEKRRLEQTSSGPRRVAVVTGYPAFDAPLAAFALRKAGVKVELFEKQWLDPREFAKYDAVVIDGSFARAKLATTKFTDEEVAVVRKYLEGGGKLWLFRERHDVLASPAGKSLLAETNLDVKARPMHLSRVKVGAGELIYVGFSPAAALPHGRKPSTVAEEEAYEAQYAVIARIASDLSTQRD